MAEAERDADRFGDRGHICKFWRAYDRNSEKCRRIQHLARAGWRKPGLRDLLHCLSIVRLSQHASMVMKSPNEWPKVVNLKFEESRISIPQPYRSHTADSHRSFRRPGRPRTCASATYLLRSTFWPLTAIFPAARTIHQS